MTKRKVDNQLAPNGKVTDLNFLWELFPRKAKFWDTKNLKRLVVLLRNGKHPKYISKNMGVAHSGVMNMIQELKRAANKGYSLEAYFIAKRPCKYGKVVLAK